LTALVSTPAAATSPAVDHAARGWRVLLLMLVIGVLAAIVTGLFGEWSYAPVVG
jgi:hypothetical protein